jgi:hypothetical protein
MGSPSRPEFNASFSIGFGNGLSRGRTDGFVRYSESESTLRVDSMIDSEPRPGLRLGRRGTPAVSR